VILLAFVGIVSAAPPVLVAGDPSDDGIQPALVPGNVQPTLDACTVLGCPGDPISLVDPGNVGGVETPDSWYVDQGPQPIAGGTFTITSAANGEIAWVSEGIQVNCVYLKGGNAGDNYDYYTEYCYNGIVNQEDSGVHTPIVASGAPAMISHIIVCADPLIVNNAPEFPTLAVPVGMMIGIVGLVYVVRKREN
jgi:hypothetical protein